MNSWLEEDDDMNENVNNEDIEDEDVEMEVDEDAELIFPYEVEGDQTPPPRDESSDSKPPNAESSDSESEDEEIDVAPEVDVAPETKSYVSGLAPLGFEMLFETSRARAILTEAEALGNVLERVSVLESGENATLKKRLDETETKLVWARMERDIAERRLHESRVWNKMFYLDMVRIGAVSKPPSDDEDFERPRKKSKNSNSDGTEGPFEPRRPPIELVFWSCIALDGDMIMPPKAMFEARMREVIREQVAASMADFMENTNHGAGGGGAGGGGAGGAGAGGAGVGGAGPAAPEITRCTYITFMKCDPQPFKGTEGANGWIASMGIDAANGTPWTEVRKWMTEEFYPQSVLQRLEQELMVEPKQVKVEQYIRGLSKNIRGDVTSSRPAGIDEAVCMAYQLMGQIIQDKTNEVSEGEKRKGEGDLGGRGDNRRDYNRRKNQRKANAGAMTNVAPNDNEFCPKCKNKKHAGDCWKCGKCGKLGHKTAACWSLDRKDVTCFNCNEKGHRKRDC
ncbi:putative reverse transcriptase domain-containing protein, partial [Tanacetum coccineum]